MCVVYAFMRRADDIADDESIPQETRRELMAAWLRSWQGDADPAHRDSAIFTALRDVQQRFGLSSHILEQLVQGTMMDLQGGPQQGIERIAVCRPGQPVTMEAYCDLPSLEGYCYFVASVVGLATIRIFGYTDERAESYAIELGKAFQFTNILRDVREDAARGRIYLPLEMLAFRGSSPEQLLQASAGEPLPPQLRAALSDLGSRADWLYRSVELLIPLIDRDSRSAMRVLASIYHALLREIQAAHFDVFSHRVRVSSWRKAALLARGLLPGGLGA